MTQPPNEQLTETIEKALESNKFKIEYTTEEIKEWLRALLEQVELKESEYQSVVSRYGTMAREYHKQKAELEQVKAERDAFLDGIRWYAEKEYWNHDGLDGPVGDGGKRARRILSQYPKGEDTNE